MQTKILSTSESDIRLAARILADGGLVAFPTETVYGLGADALNADAVARVYEAKGRPSDNPMIVHICHVEGLYALMSRNAVDDTDKWRELELLADAFWPGPLTIVVPRSDAVPDRTTGGLDTVAVRMPESETARQLIELAGCPVAAPSANISGRPSPTRAKDVIADMEGRIDAVVCGDDCRVGIESTVLDMTGESPVILRPGIITASDLDKILGRPVLYDKTLSMKPGDENFKPKAPGMKYKHYAPRAEMILIEGKISDVQREIDRRRLELEKSGRKVGIILFAEREFERAAHEFFARLRDLDGENVDVILAGALSEEDQVGFAVMNRMLKSAGYNVIRV